MFYKTNGFKLCAALLIGIIVFILPRPEGTQFKITGDSAKILIQNVGEHFTLIPDGEIEAKKKTGAYILKAKVPGSSEGSADFLVKKAKELDLEKVQVDYVDGLSPKAKRFLAILAVLIILFVFEPIPLEITAVLIGVSLVIMQITDVKNAWAPYMHPVVIFIMCCLIFAIALEKAGLTKRLGYFIIKKAGNSVTRFTFIIAIGLGLASSFMHDAAACAIGIVTMLPLMRAVGIEPHTSTAKFMMLSLPFACSSGGMGSLIGGGRCMVSAAFLKEFTGLEITFFDWILYAMPAAIITVPAAVFIVYMVYKPDPQFKLPDFDESMGAMTSLEKKTLAIIAFSFVLWLTKGLHGIDYSITGMLGVTALVLFKVLTWRDINDNLEWGTSLFIFGGGISLGLAMGYSGAADYFANLFFPLIQGKGWLVLFVGVGVFGALVTNAMANVAAAALILPIVIPMAQLEGVNPTILALCLGMATSFAMLLVIGCPPNAIAYSYRYFKSSDLTKAGLVATPILLSLLVLVAAVWWRILGLI
ncbi:Transporter, divalent anion:Na+ symporter (DASS) family protein [Desulfamplus magnetovallimortis]|uniref:Transporter, divalent anion:Na+ symporter (DASS) family protein n=1 Tax=Desulfamplus magnetovallimortis TaxID=1246637 RepID=A0A1W1HJ94_9BACT|nr:DASS family sodium-coupled anion symporter [Desulfamplus magnetovallimortis]SLM32530.1 Transporter, divalent anion:Na+ symporter (DASS) family protein [Desulfamplus magnetovallimortis]